MISPATSTFAKAPPDVLAPNTKLPDIPVVGSSSVPTIIFPVEESPSVPETIKVKRLSAFSDEIVESPLLSPRYFIIFPVTVSVGFALFVDVIVYPFDVLTPSVSV